MRILHRMATETKTIIERVFGSEIKQKGGRVYRQSLLILSPIRRILDPIFIRLLYKIGIARSKDLKLHLGCGWKHFEDYINVDIWITDATDVICDITKLPWPANSVSVIESYHVIEHISHRKIKPMLTEWFRVLAPEGILILECPYFDRAVQEYLDGNESRLMNLFGQQRFPGDTHLCGYNPSRLICLLEEIGFKEISEKEPRSSQTLDEPSFRIECRKN